MADSQLGWSDAQWQLVNNAVTEAFTKASVAGAFLPCYGPLSGSVETVRDSQLRGLTNNIRVNDHGTLRFFNLTVNVRLSSEQVADECLSSALLAFRRAANTIAQVEDDIVFNGFDNTSTAAIVNGYRQVIDGTQTPAAYRAQFGNQPELGERAERLVRTHSVVVSGPPTIQGLAGSPVSVANLPPNDALAVQRGLILPRPGLARNAAPGTRGQALVQLVTQSMGLLDASANPGPFACVLGRTLFDDAQTPERNSMVLPSDRITPMLGGSLLRSGSMVPNHGVVVSLASDAVDIVVAAPPTAQFLQRTEEARYLFRVYERFVLRIKDHLFAPVQAFVLS